MIHELKFMMRNRSPVLLAVMLAAMVFGTGVFTAAPASPVIEGFDVPDSIPVGSEINVTLKLASSFEIYYRGHDVFVHYTIGEGTTKHYKKMLYNETSGNWTGTIVLPDYINHTTKVTWEDVQVGEPENKTVIENRATDILAPEERGGPWDMVIIIVFLGATFVLIELLFKPVRGKPRAEPDDRESAEGRDKGPDTGDE